MKKQYESPELSLTRLRLEALMFSPSSNDIAPGSGDTGGDLDDDDGDG